MTDTVKNSATLKSEVIVGAAGSTHVQTLRDFIHTLAAVIDLMAAGKTAVSLEDVSAAFVALGTNNAAASTALITRLLAALTTGDFALVGAANNTPVLSLQRKAGATRNKPLLLLKQSGTGDTVDNNDHVLSVQDPGGSERIFINEVGGLFSRMWVVISGDFSTASGLESMLSIHADVPDVALELRSSSIAGCRMLDWYSNGGTLLGSIDTNGEVSLKTPSAGIILTAPDGSTHRIHVGNDGALETQLVSAAPTSPDDLVQLLADLGLVDADVPAMYDCRENCVIDGSNTLVSWRDARVSGGTVLPLSAVDTSETIFQPPASASTGIALAADGKLVHALMAGVKQVAYVCAWSSPLNITLYNEAATDHVGLHNNSLGDAADYGGPGIPAENSDIVRLVILGEDAGGHPYVRVYGHAGQSFTAQAGSHLAGGVYAIFGRNDYWGNYGVCRLLAQLEFTTHLTGAQETTLFNWAAANHGAVAQT